MAEKRRSTAMLAVVVEGFFSRLSFGLVSFALPLYAYQLGMSLTEIGVLTSLTLTASILLKPLMGSLADRFGFKRTLSAAIMLRSVIACLLILAVSPWHLYLIRGLHGASKSLRDPAVNALIAENGGKKRIAFSFAWYQTAKSLAGSAGKALAGFLLTLTASNFPLVFAIAFLLSILPLLAVWGWAPADAALRSDIRREGAGGEKLSEAPSAEFSSSTRTGTPPEIFPFAVLGGLISGAAYMLGGLFPILATEYAGLSEAETGLIYMASSAVILISGPLFGWLADNVSHKLVFTLRSAANITSSLIYVAAPTFSGVFIGRAVDDLGKSAFRPAWGALMSRVSDAAPRRRAQMMSWMSVGEDIGEILGPILAGFLWSAFGVTVLLISRAVIAAGVEIYALWATQRFQPSEAFSQRRASGKAHDFAP